MLSQTAEGKEWLAQFDPPDLDTATLLLDSLILVDQAEFEANLEQALDDFLSRCEGNIALYGAVERPKIAVEGDPWKKTNDNTKPFFPDSITEHNPKRDPEIYTRLKDVGSEGDLAHFCRDYAKKSPRLFSHPGIETLRAEHIHWIVCVDDIVASGNRMKEFIEWIYENKSIKSWHSFGWVKFIIVSYAASSVGLKLLRNISQVHEVIQCHALTSGRDTWTKIERSNIESLCKRYSRKYKLNMPLGYKDAFSMILFPHGGPNTNPSILLKNKGTWRALVQGTGRPVAVIKKAIPNDSQQGRLLMILGQTRLTKPSLFQRLNTESKKILLLLSCIAKKKRKPSVLSEMLGVPIATVQVWCTKCKELKWIDDKNFLTVNGKYALDAARRNKCAEGIDLVINKDHYYPMSLRSPAVSSSITPSMQGES